MLERGGRGYYRSKMIHYNAYIKIINALKKFLTRDNLKILDRLSNKKSVGSYASKHKTYSLTKPLEARVTPVASSQIVRYHHFWKQSYRHFKLHFDESFSANLTTLNNNKNLRKGLPHQKRKNAGD